MADEDDGREYRWETGYEKTWESIKENDDGLIASSIADIVHRSKRKRLSEKVGKNRLGILRHLYIIIDCSEAMSLQDLKPTRLLCTLKFLETFIEEYFDENPTSQIGLISMKNKRAEKITDMSGSGKKYSKVLEDLSKLNLVGEPSLQNGLELALDSLKIIPSHASREILVIIGNLTICDPSDIHQTIKKLKEYAIRCSVINLSAEVRICKYLSNETGGLASTILDDVHYRDQLFLHIDPPFGSSKDCSLIKMGFPHGRLDQSGKSTALSMCMCHVRNIENCKLSAGGFYCPQCLSKYCELPAECLSCGLTLVTALHLSRSYHHLFPVQQFKEFLYAKQVTICYSCQKSFDENDKYVYLCETCEKYFCNDCDIFVHETLHTCVGCNTSAKTISKSIVSIN